MQSKVGSAYFLLQPTLVRIGAPVGIWWSVLAGLRPPKRVGMAVEDELGRDGPTRGRSRTQQNPVVLTESELSASILGHYPWMGVRSHGLTFPLVS